MSRHLAKRRKTTAIAPAGVPAIDSLPPELLEAVFGFLDVGTLCTARFVCAQFRAAASRLLPSVGLSVETLRRRPGTTLSSFQNLSKVTVFDVKEDDLLWLAQSPVGPAVTHLRAVGHLRPVPRRGRCGRSAARSSLLPLPNLMSLTVRRDADNRDVFLPQTLRELSLEAPVSSQIANLVTGLTNLTSLRIDVHLMRKPFEGITALTALQRLEICSGSSVIPFVAELTLLTHLQFQETCFCPDVAITSLARLNRLVHRGGEFGPSMERQALASAATVTCLRSLDLELWGRPDPSALGIVCMMPFSQLTALRVKEYQLDASFLPRFTMERLQDLSLSPEVELNGDGVAALKRATGLTHLKLCTTTVGASVGLEELGIALSRMSRWRALSFGTPHAVPATFALAAIAPLSELTRLELRGHGVVTNAVVKVCLDLKKLRVLRLKVPARISDPDPPPLPPSKGISREMFWALAGLPELRKFVTIGNVGILKGDLADEIQACLNSGRRDKGWADVKLYVSPWTSEK